MTAPAPDLTLLVPCFNEAGRVDGLCTAVRAWRDAHPETSLELLCVDDGSTDDTRMRLQCAQQGLPELVVLPLQDNGGKGAALRAGMQAARGAVVLFLDADLAVDLSHVTPALRQIDAGADVVVGCRNVAGATIARSQGRLRRWMGRGYRWLACALLGLDVADVTCGFKAFRAPQGKAVFGATRCDGWGCDAEVLLLARQAGHAIVEVPVVWSHGEVSAVRLHRDVIGSLRELIGVRLRHGLARRNAAVGSVERIPAERVPAERVPVDAAAVGSVPEA